VSRKSGTGHPCRIAVVPAHELSRAVHPPEGVLARDAELLVALRAIGEDQGVVAVRRVAWQRVRFPHAALLSVISSSSFSRLKRGGMVREHGGMGVGVGVGVGVGALPAAA